MDKNYWESINKRQYVYWSGICHEERISAINHIEECINNFGFVMDYKFFSDFSMSMIIEIEERKMENLYHDLAKIIALSGYDKFDAESTKECTILLSISFTKGTGNLKIEVPAVPG